MGRHNTHTNRCDHGIRNNDEAGDDDDNDDDDDDDDDDVIHHDDVKTDDRHADHGFWRNDYNDVIKMDGHDEHIYD